MSAFKNALAVIIAGMTISGAMAQSSKEQRKQEELARFKSYVDSTSYVFVAETASPSNAQTQNMTPDFGLTVCKDSIISYLPFVGRSYKPDFNVSKSPLDFKTKSFEYQTSPGQKNGWVVVIKPRDVKEVSIMYLTVATDGYASLQVTANDKSIMSFTGYIKERKIRKRKVRS